MEIYTRRTITCDDMLKLIRVYFKSQERDVQTSFINNATGETSIKAKEKVTYEGMTKTSERCIEKEEIDRIISTVYALAGQQVVSVINYGAVGTNVMDCGFREVVKPGQENRFIVITKETQKVKIMS